MRAIGLQSLRGQGLADECRRWLMPTGKSFGDFIRKPDKHELDDRSRLTAFRLSSLLEEVSRCILGLSLISSRHSLEVIVYLLQ